MTALEMNMPHLIAEHSKDVETRNAIPALFTALMKACDINPSIDAANVKLRAQGFHSYLVAGEIRAFLHLSLAMMGGRSDDEKAALSDALMTAAISAMPVSTEITVEIRDTHRASYRKRAGA
ncbi:hypothetical protein KCG44_01415 [Pacificimonas sp. WHA3]|uniref:5-carboxymethyl-2-hydroxymuconate isomerase n=1 Tax=Pacificimonas pallii TaxID=2827236 RepID=A0ABS6SC00_9SPHN|nr:hypothetical protein [Pacificimonas pallii]MBV7255436.1 hypothetical protein [Pacificimonas pallii]